ncbi:MAG: class I SAM-dependent methyltransferase, partial [Akkermansiaceae bacterium]|nr:class I SAM-dependent methyltransferase [Akkermansiaceae bacterium]
MLRKFIGKGRRKRRSRKAPGSEQPAEFYDVAYREREGYRQHYTKSVYYFLWCVIMDRLRGATVSKMVDIGCGPGQFAALVRDTLEVDYCGIDFSSQAIEMARRLCPDFTFR